MLPIIYVLTWLMAMAAAGGLYLTGNFNETVLTIFGFIFSTLFFTGFVAVLPWWVSQPFSPKN